jgi:phosphate transport system substrate-binding protein
MLMSLVSAAKRLTTAGAVLATAAVASATADVRLQGAGATFPNPLYQKWVSEYQKAHPDTKIDYQSIGSGGGIKAITEKTVQFAGSDAPMSKKEFEAVGGPDGMIEIPTVAGAVVPAYNVPGINQPLNFEGALLADIFMGKVTSWNDARIAAANPGVKLPNLAITPAWRTDGSGTTFVFTNYLATQSEEYKQGVGTGKQVKWPAGQGGKGNEGVAAVVQQTPGAIGYIEVNYANQNKIAYGAVKNKNGKFVKATAETVSAAGQGAAGGLKGGILAADIWNQPGDNAYPIAAFTYIITYKDLGTIPNMTEPQARALADFLWWATHEGQKFAGEMDYAPLAQPVQQKVETALKSLTFKGNPILQSSGR